MSRCISEAFDNYFIFCAVNHPPQAFIYMKGEKRRREYGLSGKD